MAPASPLPLRRRRCSAASRRSPASTSRSTLARSCSSQGPNGAGKTTLLRACAGLLPIAGGEAEVLGHDLRDDRRSVRRHVGLLGHSAGLYDDLTVDENVRFAVRAARGDDAAVEPALAAPRPRRAPRLGGGRQAVGRPAPAGRPGGPRGPRTRAVAARRTPCRPRRRRARRPRPAPRRGARRWRDRLIASHDTDRATAIATPHRVDRRRSHHRRHRDRRGRRAPSRSPPVWRDAVLVAGKDLRIEVRSRVATNQVAPFAVLVLILFAFALDPDRGVLARRVGRACSGSRCCSAPCSPSSAASPSSRPTADATHCASPGSTRPASSSARPAPSPLQLAVLELLLGLGVVVLYDARPAGARPARGDVRPRHHRPGRGRHGLRRGRRRSPRQEPLLPLLVLPVVAPVLLAAHQGVGSRARASRSTTAGSGCACSPCSPSCTPTPGLRRSASCWRRRDGAAVNSGGTSSRATRGSAPPRSSPPRPPSCSGCSSPSTTSCRATPCGSIYLHPAIAWAAYLAFGVTALAERALPLEAHPVAALGPRRRRIGRDRRAVHRAHARPRVDLGPRNLGRVVDVGGAADDDRPPARAVPRLPRAAPRAGARPRSGRSDRPSPRSSPRPTSRSCTCRSSGGAPCIRAARCCAPIRRSKACSCRPLLLGIVAITLVYAWLLLHRVPRRPLEEQLEDVGLAHAIDERQAEAVSP